MNDDLTPINARPKHRRPEAVEDLSLALREHLLWPVQDRLLGLSDGGRALVAGGAVALALGVGIGGWSTLASGGSSTRATEVAAAIKPPAKAGASAPRKPKGPTLHGAPPVFKPAPAAGAPGIGGSKAVGGGRAASGSGSAATDAISSSPATKPLTATASSVARPAAPAADGPPAGPAALAVAHRFAAAFVVYETGGEPGAVRKAFEETASPDLAKALLQRPPRQPAGVEVPQAKVLNVVPAPSHGSVYPLSVSLLRVGVTSELRLQMEQLENKRWRVTDVLG